jgi:putative flippase GtrA
LTVSEVASRPEASTGEPDAGSFPRHQEVGTGALPRLWRRPGLVRRVARYAGTSVASTVTSELVLLALFGFHLATAAESAVAATVVGGMLSYILSRYWIWAEADRRRAGRQFVLYWAITIVGLLASTWVTSQAAAHISGAGAARTALVGLAYLGTYLALWVVKFGLYQRLLFRSSVGPAPA